MCFGGGGKPPSNPPPVAAVIPTPVATASTPVETESSIADKKRKQIASYQSGLASTIKTSAQGDTSSVNLLAPAATEGKKTKLGQ